MLRPLIPGLLVLLAGCTSVEWQEPPPELPSAWRGYRLFMSDLAYVLARDAAAAEEAHAAVAAARAAVVERDVDTPGRALVVALSFDDPLPIEDPERYREAIQAWHEQVVGFPGALGPDDGSPMQLRPGGRPVEVDPALPLRMVTAPVARDDAELGLPRALVEAAAFAAVVPTESCIERCADTMVDLALEAEGISRFTFHAMTLVVGNPASMLRDEMLAQAQQTLTRAWLAELGVGFATGVDPATADIPKPGEPLPASWTEVIDPRSRFCRAEPWFVVGEMLTMDPDRLLRSPVTGFVDLYTYTDERVGAGLRRAGKRYVHLPNEDRVPTRADAERLGAFYDACRQDGKGTFVYLFADHEFGAALVAAHAFWVLGKPREDALELAAELGAGALLPRLRAAFEAGEREP